MEEPLQHAFEPHELIAHAAGVRALARSLVGDVHAADDLVQQACLAALSRPPRPEVPARAWFVGVIRNLARRRRRDAERRERRERAGARPERVSSSARTVELIEMHRRLVDVVGRLDDPYRTAVALRYFEGLSVGEIAAREGVPAATVGTWLHRGLAMLRGRLDAERDDWRAALVPLAFGSRPRAPSAPPPASPPLTSLLHAGAVAMSVKKITAAAVVLLLLVASWSAVDAIVHGDADRPTATQPSPVDSTGDGAARGHVAAAAAPAVESGVDLTQVDVDRDVHGIVTDAAGRPVAGADIQAFDYPGQRVPVSGLAYWQGVEGPATHSAGDGTYALRLAPGAVRGIRFSAPGLATTEVATVPAGERLDVQLRPGVALEVRLVGDDGRTPGGGTLRVFNGDSFGRARVPHVDTTVAVDEHGRARIEALPPRAWVWVSPDVPGWGLQRWTQIDLPESGELTRTVEMVAGTTLVGRVVDAGTRVPVADASVMLSWFEVPGTTTRGDGRFELPGWSPLSQVVVDAAGYARATVTAGDGAEAEIALVRGCRVRGRLVDATGVPVADTSVGVFTLAGGEMTSLRWTRSSADGRFEIDRLAADPGTLVVPGAASHGHMLLDYAALAPGDVRDLGDVALAASRALAGRCVNADGSPAVAVWVRCTGENRDRARLVGAPNAGRFDDRGRTRTQRTDSRGRFLFANLAAGSYRIDAAGVPYGAPAAADVELGDADARDVELRFAAGTPFDVEVVDDAGAPVAGVKVTVATTDAGDVQGATELAGRASFLLPGAPATVTTYSGFAGRTFFDPEPRAVAADATSLRVVLREAGIATGIVLGPDDRPLARAMLDALQDGRPVPQELGSQVWTGSDGRFRAKVPADGRVDLVLASVLGRSADAPVLEGALYGVAPDARGLVLRTRPAALDRSLSVRVIGPDGEPIGGAEVRAWLMSSGAVGRAATTGRTGRAELSGLPARALLVQAKLPPDDPRRALWVGGEASGVHPDDATVELRFAEGVAVRGRALDASGAAVADADVAIYARHRLVASAKTDADGRFALALAEVPAEGVYLFAYRSVAGLPPLEHRDAAFRPGEGEATIRLTPPAE